MFQAVSAVSGTGALLINQVNSLGTRLTSHPGPGKNGGGTTRTYIENMISHSLVSSNSVV